MAVGMSRLLLLLCLLMMPAGIARAGCLTLSIKNLTVTQTFAGGSAAYNPFDSTTYNQTISFDVTGGGSGGLCNYFLTLGAGGSANATQRILTQGATTMNYNVYLDSTNTTVLKDFSAASLTSIIVGTFANNSSNVTNHHTISWTITPLQVKAATTSYLTDTATLTLYTGILNILPVQVDSKALTFQTKVDSSVDLSLVPSGIPFNLSSTQQTVDFGNMVSGTAKGFDMVIRSNDGYKITLTSANKQKMAYQGAATDKVSYTLKVNGAAVNLSAGTPVSPVAITGTTNSTGVAVPVVVTLGALTGTETAGTYKDAITVTVSAN